MKISILLLVALLVGCSQDQESTLNQTDLVEYAIVDDNLAVQDYPGKIPVDNVIHTLSNVESHTWEDFDKFYKEDLLHYRDEHYYENLQWITISNMIKYEDFLAEATGKVKSYYLEEIFSRKRINEPEVAVLLLMDSDIVRMYSSSQIAEYARSVFDDNKNALSTENFSDHQKRHAHAYTLIHKMGYNRHGQPR